MDSNGILHTSEDYQMLFMGGPGIHITNGRWWMAAILKNWTIWISTIIWLVLMKFVNVMHLGPPDPISQ